MEKVIRKAYAKINLGLDVLRRRPDGYHEVKMIMQTVDIWDQLTFTRSAKPGIMLQIAGAELPAGRDNLICKAAELVMREMNLNEGVEIELVKKIPIAAGMAGGSTDAAAVFHGLNCNSVTPAELNQYLESIAKLIEANAKDAKAAARIVRESKVKA